MTMQDAKQNGGVVGFVDHLNDAIRENPVAAGLVGMGVLWAFFGSAKIGAFGRALPSAKGLTHSIGAAADSAASAVGNALAGAGSAVGDAVAGTVATMSERAHQVGDSLKASGEAVSEAVALTTKDTGWASTEFHRHMGISMHQNLTKTLEAQPLLLGAIGVGIGAGIASMFSSTKTEQDLMGEAGAAVKEKIHEFAGETSERAKEVFDEVKKEAAAQGLTAASAGESLKGVVEKVRTAATESREHILSRLP